MIGSGSATLLIMVGPGSFNSETKKEYGTVGGRMLHGQSSAAIYHCKKSFGGFRWYVTDDAIARL